MFLSLLKNANKYSKKLLIKFYNNYLKNIFIATKQRYFLQSY